VDDIISLEKGRAELSRCRQEATRSCVHEASQAWSEGGSALSQISLASQQQIVPFRLWLCWYNDFVGLERVSLDSLIVFAF
jgi:hypothetical protein